MRCALIREACGTPPLGQVSAATASLPVCAGSLSGDGDDGGEGRITDTGVPSSTRPQHRPAVFLIGTATPSNTQRLVMP